MEGPNFSSFFFSSSVYRAWGQPSFDGGFIVASLF